MRLEHAVAAIGPLDGIPPQGRIQTGYWRGFKRLVRERGGDPRLILERHDLDANAFEDPEYHIDCTAVVNLFEDCSSRLQDPLFGLYLAERQDPEVLGCVAELARAAPTLREALQSLVDYIPVCVSPECELEMVTTRDIVELRWWTTQAVLGESAQVHYHGLQLLTNMLKLLVRDRFRLRYATLAFEVGRHQLQSLQDRLACRVNGQSTSNAIAFSAELLDCPLQTRDRMLFAILTRGLADIRAASKAGFVQQVEAYVRQALPTHECSVDRCAETLGMSARTLQKRLMRIGCKFVDIVQSERIKLAKHALLWTDSTLDEIAFRLGYSEQSNFGRAFKRATGHTPQSFRVAALRSSAADRGCRDRASRR